MRNPLAVPALASVRSRRAPAPCWKSQRCQWLGWRAGTQPRVEEPNVEDAVRSSPPLGHHLVSPTPVALIGAAQQEPPECFV